MNSWFSKFAAVMALAVSLSACAGMPQGVQNVMRNVAPIMQRSPEDDVRSAMDALNRGDAERARPLLQAALQQEPHNGAARRLLDEIDGDPRRQLGVRSRAYTVQPTDTMQNLAQRFAGDPLMFYALARYNNMAPNQLAAGQIIQIPDRGRPSATTASNSLRGALPVSPAPNTTPTAPVAAVPAAASTRANRLRLEGLERLNAGDADGAVTLLTQARSLDSANLAIQNDLLRAQRIQASLH